MGAQVLLTGCTGFVGKVVLEHLLRQKDALGIDTVHVLVRPRRGRSAASRFDAEIAASACFSRAATGWRLHCRPVAGDITAAGLGLGDDEAARLQGCITHIVHCAASVSFDLPLAEAAEVNTTGALQMLAFAQRCRRLQRLVDVSTAYVTPHPGNDVAIEECLVELPFDAESTYADILAGRADERALLAVSGHPNTYTLTKCLAERLLVARRGDVPLTLLRPSIVAACRRHPQPGWIDSHAAYAAFIALFGAGYLRAVRIDPQTVLDLVPCDEVADRILACCFDPALQAPLLIRHATTGLARGLPLAQLAERHLAHFRRHPHPRAARWHYVGRSAWRFTCHDWMHHRAPLAVAQVAARVSGRSDDARRIRRLAGQLARLDRTFHHFAHHSFDFRSSFPAVEHYDPGRYVDTISAGVSRHLLRRDPRQAPLCMHGPDLLWACGQPDGNATVRTLGYFVRKTLRAARTEITFDETELAAALADVDRDELIVLAPSHRSYFDFLITSLLCFAHPGLGLRIPRVAATDDFARIPIVGPLLRTAGAFYIRRGLGRPDPALSGQLAELVRQGHCLEFYPEGRRSRSRRFIAPKRGILRALQQTGRRARVLPLSINYDRIAEECGFVRELEGREVARSGLAPIAHWLARLSRGQLELGRVHLRCARPLILDEHTDVHALSRDLMAGLQRASCASTFHLRVFCRRHPGIDPDRLRAAIEARGGVVIDSRLDETSPIPAPLVRSFECQWMHLFYADALARWPDDAAVRAHVRRNGYWVPPAARRDDVTDEVLRALFTPIRNDHRRVRAHVQSLPPGADVSVPGLLRTLPDAFLREVEDALDELVESGIITAGGSQFRRGGDSLALGVRA